MVKKLLNSLTTSNYFVSCQFFTKHLEFLRCMRQWKIKRRTFTKDFTIFRMKTKWGISRNEVPYLSEVLWRKIAKDEVKEVEFSKFLSNSFPWVKQHLPPKKQALYSAIIHKIQGQWKFGCIYKTCIKVN